MSLSGRNAIPPKGGICFVTGEASGDAQASLLLAELKKMLPKEDRYFWGIAGPLLKNEGVEAVLDTEMLSVMGASEVIKQYPTIIQCYKKILFEIQKRCPRLIILVDYPGFNLRLAEAVTQLGFHVIYYIPPKVWSHGLSRINKLKKYANLILSILPFEDDFFKNVRLNSLFVGNPLFDKVCDYLHETGKEKDLLKTKNSEYNVNEKYLIGMLPGSRKPEIERLLPLMIRSFVKLSQKFPHAVAQVPIAHTLSLEFIINIFKETCLKNGYDYSSLSKKIHFLNEKTYNVMNNAHYCWICSGTASLEAAFFRTPMSVIYKTSAVTWFLGKMVVKVKYLSPVNLCLNKAAVPEFLQEAATVDNLVSHAVEILEDSQKRKSMIFDLETLCRQFPKHGARTSAQAITDFLKRSDASLCGDFHEE